MTNPTIEVGDVEARLLSIISYVQDCERRIMKGEIMELSGLDNKVIEICDDIAALPAIEGQTLEDDMAKLIEKLEVLATRMREQQDSYSTKGTS